MLLRPLPETPRIDVIVSDVDGTLIDSLGTIPTENIDALQMATERGVRLALATIRKRDTAGSVADRLGVPCAMVCEGGATTYNVDGDLVRRVSLPEDVALAIATLADDRQFPLATTIDAVNYYGPGYEPTPLLGAESASVVSNRAALIAPPTRMVVRAEDALAFIVQEFADAPLHVVRHYRANGDFIDGVITHTDANKAAGVAALLERWGLTWENTMAIGDAEADLGMIERARVGVAMANATEVIREIADYVTLPASQAGVAQAIKRFVLIDPPDMRTAGDEGDTRRALDWATAYAHACEENFGTHLCPRCIEQGRARCALADYAGRLIAVRY